MKVMLTAQVSARRDLLKKVEEPGKINYKFAGGLLPGEVPNPPSGSYNRPGGGFCA